MRGILVDASCRVGRKARGNGRGSGWRHGETRGWLVKAVDGAVGCQSGLARQWTTRMAFDLDDFGSAAAHVSSGSAMLIAAATAGSAIRLLYETSTTAVLVRLWRYVRTKARRRPSSGTDLGSAMTRRQSVVCHDGPSPASDVQRSSMHGGRARMPYCESAMSSAELDMCLPR